MIICPLNTGFSRHVYKNTPQTAAHRPHAVRWPPPADCCLEHHPEGPSIKSQLPYAILSPFIVIFVIFSQYLCLKTYKHQPLSRYRGPPYWLYREIVASPLSIRRGPPLLRLLVGAHGIALRRPKRSQGGPRRCWWLWFLQSPLLKPIGGPGSPPLVYSLIIRCLDISLWIPKYSIYIYIFYIYCLDNTSRETFFRYKASRVSSRS